MGTPFAIVFEDPRQYRIFAHPISVVFELLASSFFLINGMIMLLIVGVLGGFVYCAFVRRNPIAAFGVTLRDLGTGLVEVFGLLGRLLPYAVVVFVPAAAASGMLSDLGSLDGAFGINQSNAGAVSTTFWMIWFVALLACLFFWPSLQRVRAIAWLCFKEALRGRIMLVFLLFFVPFLFAGWYLQKTPDGTLLYLCGFVNTAITFILLPLVIFMVSMSLPNEIQARIVQTIVTKPVRRSEIVLGRALGYIGIYSVVLGGMGLVSGLYIYGQLTPEQREKLWVTRKPILANMSAPDGVEYYLKSTGAKPNYPLLFKRGAKWDVVGTNVGKEWSYRYHIGGQTPDSAHFGFKFDPTQVGKYRDPELGDDACNVLMEFDVFKMTKGDPTRDVGAKADASGVRCLIEVKQLDAAGQKTDKQYGKIVRIDHQRITTLPVPASLCTTGYLEVAVKCVTIDQFVGMAPGDLYLLAKQGSFAGNFAKALASIWLKMIVIICVAVAASTVLKGFVTVLLASTMYIVGVFWGFMWLVAIGPDGALKGGGPFESLIRIATQANQVTALDMSNPVTFIFWNLDQGVLWLMRHTAFLIPNLSDLETMQFVAHGVDVPGALVLRNAVIVFAYVVPVLVVGYFLLRNRELAA